MSISPRQLEQLMQDLEDGCISAPDHELLMHLLTHDPVARQKYCRHMAFAGAMHVEAEAREKLGDWTPKANVEGKPGRLFASSVAAAAAVLIVAAVAGALVSYQSGRPQVVELMAPQESEWTVIDENGENLADAELREGATVRVEAGLVSFTMKCGARMIIQGPGEVTFPTLNTPVLESGTLWIDVVPESEPMRVSVRDYEFRDIGTRFGVSLIEDGRVKLVVSKGTVSARNRKLKVSHHCSASRTATLFDPAGGRELVVADEDPFPELPALLEAAKSYTTVVLGQSPVGFWHMENSDSTGLANAVSPKHPGQADTEVNFGTAGPSPETGFMGMRNDNRCANLPGNSHKSVIYDLDSPQGVSPERGAVSFWFRRGPDLNHREVLWFAGAAGATQREIQLFLMKGGRLHLFVENGEEDILLATGRSVHDEEWHHVAASWGETTVSLHLDGKTVASDEGLRIRDSTRFRGLNVRVGKIGPHPFLAGEGKYNWNVDDAYTGLIDEVALWDRALSEGEVKRQYEAAVGKGG